MGIDIDTYRARIGCFCIRSGNGIIATTTDINIGYVAGLLMNKTSNKLLTLALILILLVIGGVEKNPGPVRTRAQLGNDWQSEFLNLHKEMDEMRKEVKYLRKKVEYLEIQSKQKNVVIQGMAEEDDGNLPSRIIEKVKEKLDIDIRPEDLAEAHRLGKHRQLYANGQNVKPRPVLCRFTSSKPKFCILDKVKTILADRSTRTRLKDVKFLPDFTDSVRESRRNLIPHLIQLRDEHKNEQGYKCFLTYDKLSAGGVIYKLNPEDDSLVRV